MVVPHVTTSLVDTFGWRGAFRAQALYCSIIVALTGLTFRPVRKGSSVGQKLDEKGDDQANDDVVVEVVPPGHQPVKYWHYHRSYLQLLMDKTFLLFVVALALYSFASFIPMLYIVRVLLLFLLFLNIQV